MEIGINNSIEVFLSQYPFLIITTCLNISILGGSKEGTVHLVNRSIGHFVVDRYFFLSYIKSSYILVLYTTYHNRIHII